MKVGLAFTAVIVGSPASEVITTLSIYSPELASISVISIVKPFNSSVNATLVVTADFPEPCLGSKPIPSVLIPPKLLFSILG